MLWSCLRYGRCNMLYSQSHGHCYSRGNQRQCHGYGPFVVKASALASNHSFRLQDYIRSDVFTQIEYQAFSPDQLKHGGVGWWIN